MKRLILITIIFSIFVAPIYTSEFTKEINIAFSLRITGNVDKAVEIINNLKDTHKSKSDILYYELARIEFYKGNMEKAIEIAKQSIKVNPNNYKYHRLVGSILVFKAVKSFGSIITMLSSPFTLKKAKPYFKSAYELNGNEVEARMSYVYLCSKLPYFLGRDIDAAKIQIKEIEKLDKVKSLVASNAFISDNNEKIKKWEKLIKIYPDRSESYESLSRYYFRTKQYNKGRECVKKAAQLNPRRAFLYFEMSHFYLKAERYKEAIESINDYLKLNIKHIIPYKAFAYKVLSDIYKESGKIEKSKLNLQKAKELDKYYWKGTIPPPDYLFEPIDF